MRIPGLGLVLPRGLALGASLCISEHGLLLPEIIQPVFSTVIHSIQVFGFFTGPVFGTGAL